MAGRSKRKYSPSVSPVLASKVWFKRRLNKDDSLKHQDGLGRSVCMI